MYKDKALQRETTRKRVRRYRNKQKALQKEGVTGKGVTGVTLGITAPRMKRIVTKGGLVFTVPEGD